MIFDNKAQAGGVIMMVFGILIIGFFYVAFGGIMNQIWIITNTDIAAGNFHYTQDHRDTMDVMFKFWWAVPVIAVIVFIVYTIVIGIRKRPGEV